MDLSVTYNIKEYPVKISGRYNPYNNAKFKCSVRYAVFLSEYRYYGIKKLFKSASEEKR